MRRGRAVSSLKVTVAAVALVVVGCAYFNTLYNAKKKYEDAQKQERVSTQSREVFDQFGNQVGTRSVQKRAAPVGANAQAYEDVITKCRNVIARYPKSRHVDDAMLLIGKSLYALQRYDECVAALDSLTSRYPKTNLREDAQFLKGKALVSGERYEAAVTELTNFVDTYRKSGDRPEAFYLLCTSLMQLGLADNAVVQLERLEKDHGRSEYRYRAQTDMASILVDKGLYKESLAVYERLSSSRIPSKMRYDVWAGMSRSQIELGQYQEAIGTLENFRNMSLTPDQQPNVLMLRARAYAGTDSTEHAIDLYKTVATRFSRSAHGAEADFRLGVLYESIDSLQTAQKYYQEVPRAFSGSEFAEDAIKRAGDIGRVLRLQETAGDDSPEAVALRTFSMAEIQLLQFKNADKAIPNYEKIVHDFPDSDFAPKSAYALGYIYGVVKQDSVKAREWYDILRTRYGNSQQAQLAYAFYKGAAPPPSLSEMMRYGEEKPAPAGPVVQDTSRVQPPVVPAGQDTSRVAPPVVPPDTTRTRVLPDSLREPVPVAPDSSASQPDTSSHGN